MTKFYRRLILGKTKQLLVSICFTGDTRSLAHGVDLIPGETWGIMLYEGHKREFVKRGKLS